MMLKNNSNNNIKINKAKSSIIFTYYSYQFIFISNPYIYNNSNNIQVTFRSEKYTSECKRLILKLAITALLHL